MNIREEKGVFAYLEKRGLIKQYTKQKLLIEAGYYDLADLKKMSPKSAGIYYFRINQKYRAIGFIEEDTLVIAEIWDHQ